MAQKETALTVTQRGWRVLGRVPVAATVEMAKHGFLPAARACDQEVVLHTTFYFLGQKLTRHMDRVLQHLPEFFIPDMVEMVCYCVAKTNSDYISMLLKRPEQVMGHGLAESESGPMEVDDLRLPDMDIRWSHPCGAEVDDTRIYLNLDAVFPEGMFGDFISTLKEQAALSAASALPPRNQLAP